MALKQTLRTSVEILDAIAEVIKQWQELDLEGDSMSNNMFALKENLMGYLSGLYWSMGYEIDEANQYAEAALSGAKSD